MSMNPIIIAKAAKAIWDIPAVQSAVYELATKSVEAIVLIITPYIPEIRHWG
jgi:hypothetical protein